MRTKFHPNYATKQFPTVGDLLALHEQVSSSLGLRSRTAKSYRNNLVRIIRLAKNCSKDSALLERVCTINESLALKAKTNWAQNMKLNRQGEARTFNSILRDAKAIFSKEAVATYRSHSPSWDFRETRSSFLQATPFRRVQSKWVCPTEETIKNIHWNIENLAGGELYAIMALAFYGGLRCSEICAITTDWVRENSTTNENDVQINVFNTDAFTAKGRQGYTVIKKTQWERILERRTALGKGLVRMHSRRTVSKKASHFLKNVCGIEAQKPLHELRKLFGAYVSSKEGLYTAQLYLRHQDPKTTYNSYSGVLLSKDCLTLWDK